MATFQLKAHLDLPILLMKADFAFTLPWQYTSYLTNYTVDDQLDVLQTLAQDQRFTDPQSLMRIGIAYDSFDNPERASLIDRMWNITTRNNLSVVTSHYLGGPGGRWVCSYSRDLARSLTFWPDKNDAVTLHKYGWLNTSIPVVLSHASTMDAANAELLRQTDQYISTTPESEMHYGIAHQSSYLIQDQASIGVDTHCTFGSSMVWQACLWLQALRSLEFDRILDQWEVPINNPMSVKQAFHLITRSGVIALRNPDIGVIREGAKADVVVFDTCSPTMLGWNDPLAAITLHSSPGDVQHVIINGKLVKRDGRLTYVNYEDLRTRFLQSASRIQAIYKNMTWPPLEGKFNNFSRLAPTSQIDTQRSAGTGY